MPEKEIRKEGYYRVRYKEGLDNPYWVVMHFQGRRLSYDGDTYSLDSTHIAEIDENRILMRDELEAINNTTKEVVLSPSELSQQIEDFVKENPVLYDIFFKYFRAHE